MKKIFKILIFICFFCFISPKNANAFKCSISINPSSNIKPSDLVTATFDIRAGIGSLVSYQVNIDATSLGIFNSGVNSGLHTIPLTNLLPGDHKLWAVKTQCPPLLQVCSPCEFPFSVLNKDGSSSKEDNTKKGYQGLGVGATGPCSSIDKDKNKTELDKCLGCITGEPVKDPNYPGSWSALGCIPTDPQKFIQWLLNNAINIVGGIAFLLVLFGSFKVATSSGNPEALNEGKDIIFAALAGLLFIVFSVVLLKIIGADILQIPGFE